MPPVNGRTRTQLASIAAGIAALALLSAGSSDVAPRATALPMADAIEVPGARAAGLTLIPFELALPPEPQGHADRGALAAVSWSAPETKSLAQLSWTWNISKRRLVRLNPDVDPNEPLPAGTPVRVFDAESGQATRSIGAPNRGRLVHGVPMPEGDAWTMKAGRARVYGTAETVQTLHETLLAYGETFDAPPPVRIRDLSARGGRRIAPHRSHQSGRDVDIGFVLEGVPEGSHRVSEETFDAEKNWFLVRSLIDSGRVQAIYTSGKAKRWLRQAAIAEVGEEQAESYLDLISYEHGHSHHMHVRFVCADEHRGCLDRSAQGKPRRRPSA